MYRLKFSLILIFVLGLSVKVFAENPRPLRALLIAGGCCHDYANQQRVLREGIQARANVRVDVYWTDNSTTSPVFPLYGKLNWAEEYDVIIHDECGSSVDDPALVNRIIQVHKRLPAVHLHCAMHSFRTGGNEWFEHLGLQSSGHGPQQPIDIIFHGNDHPITRGLKNWTTVNEELYNNVKLFGAKPLAIGKQAIPGPNPRIDEAVVAWTNETQGAKSFSTTIGHNTATVEDARYLDLVARGLLWACDQLNDEYLIPYTGEQTTIFIDKDKYKAPGDDDLGAVPPDATLVKVTASSTQNGHPPYHAVDGKVSTRWCADGDSYPQSITIEFEKPQPVQEVQIRWEFEDRQYHARIEGETSESTWLKLYDDKVNGNQTIRLSESAAVKKLRITSEKAFGGGWCSIKEIVPIGETIRTIWPAEMNNKGAFTPLRGDPFENAGNTIPKIVPLSPEQEAEILREVQVPDGFKATVFAAPPAVNYPVFVASSVDGTLFVSSDGNGSLGRDPSRGRIIRLRDLDGDGRADETKIFCEIDAPRGLLWDRDRLFVMHPPNLSVFFDHDNDGVADEQRTIVKNLAFGYEDRPADHTTNGLSIGVDGWIYIAGGDFGFINALGSDGTQLTHRGGGVIRVRPDGTQLQLYSTGTRNILEVAISPEMEMFARDNTNDGGGWDVRLHHFTGQEDHGYPRLYKNFNDECIQPLADYGGGSGCGAVYVAEPGFGDWGDAPFTADWGTGALYRHQVARSGASYKETEAPRPFVRLTRPTDADIDGNSRLYCASWKGATFNWNGPDVGYVVCVQPNDYTPPVMPDFKNLSEDELVDQFDSPSHRRRLAAQRELFYRESSKENLLHQRAIQNRPEDRNLLDQLQTNATATECIEALLHEDEVIRHTAIRVIANRGAASDCFSAIDNQHPATESLLKSLAMIHRPDVVEGLTQRLHNASGKQRIPILAALCRLHFTEGDWNGDSWGTRPDTRGPYYQPATWDLSESIRNTLEQALDNASPAQASLLVELMRVNRIQSDRATEKMIRLAITEKSLLSETLEQLTRLPALPDSVNSLLKQTSSDQAISEQDRLNLLKLLCRNDVKRNPAQVLAMIDQLATEQSDPISGQRVAEILKGSANADQFFAASLLSLNASEAKDQSIGRWVLAMIVAGKNDASPEQKKLAVEKIESGIKDVDSQSNILRAAVWISNRNLDTEIWNLQTSPAPEIAGLAKTAVQRLKIDPPNQDNSPLIKSLELTQALALVTDSKGDQSLGKAIFEKAKCSTCHTLSQQEAQKGPYLGNIAKTYKRPELAVAILQPEKTIAQGFATNSFLTSDGVVLTGFVTDEQNDRVVLRDQNGKEYTLLKEDIEVRKKLPTSMMPSGILDEFTVFQASSLIDYLNSLATQNE